jgi:L-lactate utilization protein LutC
MAGLSPSTENSDILECVTEHKGGKPQFANPDTVWYDSQPMEKDNIQFDSKTPAEKFKARAAAVAARVSVAANEEAVNRLIAEDKTQFGTDNVGVVRAALGIAETGTCVVETDDEATRLSTMLPETSIIILKTSNIVPALSDIAPYLRERQKDGKISYTSLITGPSRTADIERVGAIGVHGPLDVHIILQEG